MSTQDMANLVKQLITSDKIVIFSKTTCPYCKMAKEVHTEINILLKIK